MVTHTYATSGGFPGVPEAADWENIEENVIVIP
jgi:hypothetical protein